MTIVAMSLLPQLRFTGRLDLQKIFVVMVLITLLQTSSTIPHHRLKKVPKSIRVQDCYIVHILPRAQWTEAEQLIQDLEELNEDISHPNFSAQVVGKMIKLVYGFAAKLSPEALEYVLNSTIVSFVEEDQVVKLGQQQQPQTSRSVLSWGIDRIDQVENILNYRYNPPCNLTGRGVDVYIMDTGIFYNHDQFQERATFSGCDMIDDYDDPTVGRRGSDCNGHGTGVAGVVGGSSNGVASGVNLLSVRVINCSGVSSMTFVLKGLECVYNRTRMHPRNPAVINFSIYGPKNAALKRAVDRLLKQGITVVALSGNSAHHKSGNACRRSPGSIHGVITVGSTKPDDFAHEDTNMGQCVDLLAPGLHIQAAAWLSYRPQCTDCEAVGTGSSFAAPHVTGAIALLLERCPHLTPWEVKYHLLRSMTLVNQVEMNLIPRRLRVNTPNLLLHVGPSMCTIEC